MGKSYALLADPMRYFDNPNFSGLLVRKTNDELRELKMKSQLLYKKAFPGAVWREKDSTWKFPSGAQLWMSYLDRDDDVSRYQGLAFTWIGFDELTHWSSSYVWDYLFSRLRSEDPSLRPHLSMRATTNPGGVGHCVPFGEVLTSNGWVDITKVKEGDTVVSVTSSGEQTLSTVSGVIKEPFKGEMVYRKDQMVFTSNHRLPLVTDSGALELRPFYNLPGQCNIARSGLEMPKTLDDIHFNVPTYPGPLRTLRLKQPDRITQLQYAKLMGWFLSEGHTLDRDKEFGISQTKEPQRSQIKTLLEECNFKFRESSTGFAISSPKWWSYLKQFGKCRDKFIPRELLTSPFLNSFFSNMMAGDGHWVTQSSGSYYTTSEQLADDMLEVSILLGYSARLSSRQRVNRVGLSYEVHFTERKTTELVTGNHLYDVSTTNSRVNCSKSKFNGFVYCLTVPGTETFFLRQNGYVWVSGNSWVKKLFVDPAIPGDSFPLLDSNGEPIVNKKTNKALTRRFIPARLSDNPYLDEGGEYEAGLSALPEAQRKKLLEGSWDVMEGAAFPEFDRNTHVVEPFEIPHNWRRFRSCDYGYRDHTAVYWFAINPTTSQLVVYRELYINKITGKPLARLILSKESEERVDYGILDGSVWRLTGQTGPSVAEDMISEGCRWRVADRGKGSRLNGKNRLHEILSIDEFGNPGIVFFPHCRQILADLPMIPSDPKGGEDIDPNFKNDHSYDSLRYGIMSRPKPNPMDTWGATTPSYTPSDSAFGY